MMQDIGFLPSITAFDRDVTNDETVELLHPYMCLPDMTPDDAKKVRPTRSRACARGSRAMALYVDIAKVVKPKMESLAIAQGKLKSANAKLAKAQGELDEVAESSTRCSGSSTRRSPTSRRCRTTPTRA